MNKPTKTNTDIRREISTAHVLHSEQHTDVKDVATVTVYFDDAPHEEITLQFNFSDFERTIQEQGLNIETIGYGDDEQIVKIHIDEFSFQFRSVDIISCLNAGMSFTIKDTFIDRRSEKLFNQLNKIKTHVHMRVGVLNQMKIDRINNSSVHFCNARLEVLNDLIDDAFGESQKVEPLTA
jgi:hypothetical protein